MVAFLPPSVRAGLPRCRPALTILLLVASARAQEGAPPGSEAGGQLATARVRPPELGVFVEAEYPKAALDARIEGRVVLELTVSESGLVTGVRVVEGIGHGLDEAAVDAARGLIFSPAMVGGESKAARVRYAYDFRLPEHEPPLAVAPTIEVAAPASALPEAPISEAPTPGAPSDERDEVVVVGLRAADKQLRSAAAVTVVDLGRAKRESADLAEVLSRVEGVNVQRMGGLGSEARFTLAGFDDSQIRFFIDGIPLEYQGFSMGLQNVPMIFAERVDVYKGVVPVALGADSLGGAFNLLTDRATRGTRAFASYQAGSFDTHRFAGGARHLDDRTGLFVKAEGFYDSTDNDYPVDVEVGTPSGDTVLTPVHRFHDAYEAGGVNLEAGFVGKEWAERLLLKGFINGYGKELQHDPLMSSPYGEAEYGGLSSGVSLRYEHYFGRGLRGSFVTGYVFDRTDFLDDPECSYGWFGQCQRESIEGLGEVRRSRTDQSVWDSTGYGRWNLGLGVAPGHEVSLSLAPTYFTRQGENRLLSENSRFNPLKAQRDMLKWINGIEYEARLLDDRLENRLFGKAYLMATQSVEVTYDTMGEPLNAQDVYWGVGDGVRFSLTDFLLAKASYEYAIRIPEPGEIFGNTVQIVENLELAPERSHNVNLSLLLVGLETESGTFGGSLTGFFRDAEQLILLVGRADVFRFENAYAAEVYGVEGASTWLAPGEHLELGLNATYQEYRNRSEEGSYQSFSGDRIPNRPYFFGNATARLLFDGVMTERDELALTWYSHYTHEFYRFWESVGSRYDLPVVPSQLVHTLVLSYLVRGKNQEELALSAEAQNLTDEKVFDFYRVQKPGRAAYFKISFSY